MDGIGQFKPVDIGLAYLQAKQIGTQSRLADLQIQQEQQKAQQLQALNDLKLKAAKGDAASRAIVTRLDPEYAKKLQDYENQKTVYYGSQAKAIQGLPLSMRNEAYNNLYKKAQEAGEDVSQFPVPDDEWSDLKEGTLDFLAKASIEPAKQMELEQESRKLNSGQSLSATERIANRLAAENKTNFTGGLQMYQTGFRQGTRLNEQGEIESIPGFDETRATTEGTIARAKEKEKILGGKEGEKGAKVIAAPAILDQVARAEELLPKASSGAIQAGVTAGAKYLGKSTEAGRADAALKVIAANLTSNVPRMEGPQSDKDTQMYKEAAANVADSKLPYKDRLAALQEIKRLNKKYLNQDQTSGAIDYKSKYGLE